MFTTKKLLSLLVLASCVVAVHADREKRKKCEPCSSEKRDRRSKEKCKDKKQKKDCCKALTPELAFKAKLTFAQTIDPEGEPRTLDDQPGTGCDQATGTFEICFAEDFSRADYRLTLCNINKNFRNANEKVLGAFLVFGSPGFTVEVEDIGADLCNLTSLGNEKEEEKECGEIEGNFCCCGTLTNKSIRDNGPLHNIVDIYDQMRARNVGILINGSDTCVDNAPNTPKYGFNSGGLLRGALFTRFGS